MDTIIISDLEIHTQIGCTSEERAFPQKLHISAEIEVDNTTLLSSANLDDGVCYATVCDEYTELAGSQEWIYVEDLLEAFSKRTFERFSAAKALTLDVKKYAVPRTAYTGLSIKRSRGE